MQSPVNSVVKAIYVDDGQKVLKGDRLLSLDPTAAIAQNASLQQIRTSLVQENQFYTEAMHGSEPKDEEFWCRDIAMQRLY